MNKLIQYVVMAAVGVLIFSALLVPIINDATTTEKTFNNSEGALFQVEKFDTDSSYSFEWIYTDPTHATINNETVTLSNATVICATDSFLIRYGQDTSNGYYLQSVGGGLGAYASETNKTTLTINVNGGSLTSVVSNEGSTPTSKTIAINEGYGIVAKGNYVMKAPTQGAYMLNDSPIVAMGLTALDGVWSNMFQITGTVEGVEVEQISPAPATYSISDVEINSVAVAGYEDLSELNSITFVATQIADTTKVHDCTYNYFIVPAEVTADITVTPDDATRAIMGVIPLIVIVGLIAGIVGVIAVRRNA